jgi:transposase
MDETSTDLWDKRGKIWQPKDSILPMVIQKSRDRGKSITIIGGISLQMNEMYFQLVETTNKVNVENFFKKFHNKVDLSDKVIVMDNHAAHVALEVQDFIESKGIRTLFLPPCSSYFNPIETIWSWVKGKWRNSLL